MIKFCYVSKYRFNQNYYADMAESADALASGASESNLVEVQVLLSAPNLNRNFDTKLRFCFFARKHRNNGIFTKRKVSE